jgi:hypothetical protein
MLLLTILIQVEMMRKFNVVQKSQSSQLFAQSELNYVIRSLGLPKENAEHLGSRLKENNLLAAGTSMYWYRSRQQEFTSYFSQDGDKGCWCNIYGLMQKFDVEYKVNEWRIFIHSSKISLKAVFSTTATTTLRYLSAT